MGIKSDDEKKRKIVIAIKREKRIKTRTSILSIPTTRQDALRPIIEIRVDSPLFVYIEQH